MHPEIKETLEKDILAGDLYNLACGLDLYDNSDYVRMPFWMQRRRKSAVAESLPETQWIKKKGTDAPLLFVRKSQNGMFSARHRSS